MSSMSWLLTVWLPVFLLRFLILLVLLFFRLLFLKQLLHCTNHLWHLALRLCS